MHKFKQLVKDNFTLFNIVITIACVLLANEIIYTHAITFEYTRSEQSIIEISQDFALALMITIAAWAALKKPEWRELFIAIATVAAMMLIREQNNWFKTELFRGAWQIAVFSVLAGSSIWLLPRRAVLAAQLKRILTTQQAATGAIGLFILLIFSRLFGKKVIWENVLGEGFIYSAKMVIEESVELLGYSLMLAALINLTVAIFLKIKIVPEKSPQLTLRPS